jgi:delta 1-pyrroline-5-carboxylate dehydrogenase
LPDQGGHGLGGHQDRHRTAASVVFTAATEVGQTLSTTLANIRGSSTEAITVVLTTDHTGVLANA